MGALRRKYTLNLKMFFLLIREATIICSQYLVSVTLDYDIRAFNVCRLEKRHVSLLACYLISNLIVSCLNHFNNIISACFPKYTLFLVLRVAYILSQEQIT